MLDPALGLEQSLHGTGKRLANLLGAAEPPYHASFQAHPLPPGHRLRNRCVEPIQLVYFTDRHYNPADEFRIAYNHPAIACDWETQHK